MEDNDLNRRLNLLRTELKTWERSNSTNGNKPTREVIKRHPEIASKYSEFQRLKDVISGKPPVDASALPTTKPPKRKHEEHKASTPPERVTTALTPTSKRMSSMPYDLDPYDSPSLIRKLFTPSAMRYLGPTPQKDGVPLGIFDLLSEVETPITSRSEDKLGHAPPSKRDSLGTGLVSIHKLSRTPESSSKNCMPDAFLTPSDRLSKLQEINTPMSVSKLDFGTPSFLRRGGVGIIKGLPSIQEDDDVELPSPETVRLPQRALLVRGLSSIAAELRQAAEEAAEEDLDILRELENDSKEQGNITPSTQKSNRIISRTESQPVQDGVCQMTLSGGLLGGFDDIAMFDSEVEEQQDRGQPLEIYKKKGQKRTTRRANLKPVRQRSTKVRKSASHDADTDEEQHVPPDLDISRIQSLSETISDVPEGFKPDARNFDTDTSGSDYTASEGGTRYRRAKQKQKKIYDEGGKEKKVGRRRKVGTMATSNFKRLKLRNNGHKGGLGNSSRFRRKK